MKWFCCGRLGKRARIRICRVTAGNHRSDVLLSHSVQDLTHHTEVRLGESRARLQSSAAHISCRVH